MALVAGMSLVVIPASDVEGFALVFGVYAVLDGFAGFLLGARARWNGELVRGGLGVMVGLATISWAASIGAVAMAASWAWLTGFAELWAAWSLRRVVVSERLLTVSALTTILLAMLLVGSAALGGPGPGALVGLHAFASAALLPAAVAHVRRFARTARPKVRVLTTPQSQHGRPRQYPHGRERRP